MKDTLNVLLSKLRMKQLHLLIALDDHKSLYKAAGVMSMTQSAACEVRTEPHGQGNCRRPAVLLDAVYTGDRRCPGGISGRSRGDLVNRQPAPVGPCVRQDVDFAYALHSADRGRSTQKR